MIRQLDSAARQWGPVGVAGVYGVSAPTEVHPNAPLTATGPATRHPPQPHPKKFAVKRMGRVIHRARPLFDSPTLPARVSTLDELLLVVPRNTPLQFDPALGFHLYGADICLLAQELGLAVVALDAACHHNTREGNRAREGNREGNRGGRETGGD